MEGRRCHNTVLIFHDYMRTRHGNRQVMSPFSPQQIPVTSGFQRTNYIHAFITHTQISCIVLSFLRLFLSSFVLPHHLDDVLLEKYSSVQVVSPESSSRFTKKNTKRCYITYIRYESRKIQEYVCVYVMGIVI